MCQPVRLVWHWNRGHSHHERGFSVSLILDALNRSRGELDQVPTLGTRHDYADRRLPVRMWGLLVVLALAFLVIAWLLWDRAASPPASADVPQAVSQQGKDEVHRAELPSVPPVVTAKASAAPPPEQKPAPKMLDQAVAPAAATVQPSPGGSSPDVTALYSATPAAAAVPDAQKPATQVTPAKEPARMAEPSVDEQGLDIEQLVRKAEDELENARLAEHPAPFITDLSQQTKDAIPSIFYERHDYSGRPGQSTVVLNGKELKAGGSPASGVKVIEILSDSVVLDYRGTQFRLRALNSWVNL